MIPQLYAQAMNMCPPAARLVLEAQDQKSEEKKAPNLLSLLLYNIIFLFVTMHICHVRQSTTVQNCISVRCINVLSITLFKSLRKIVCVTS